MEKSHLANMENKAYSLNFKQTVGFHMVFITHRAHHNRLPSNEIQYGSHPHFNVS